jgi:phosphonopyruvate decarboxylase
MLKPEVFLESLTTAGISFFAGVPDSLLKQFCGCITDMLTPDDHIIAANEGAAVGLAIGYHIATGNVPLIYMQNSGLGNIVNPIMSLASKEVYGIPMLVMIGWRGEPGVKDEPQHVHQGRVTPATLDAMEMAYVVLSDDDAEARSQVADAAEKARAGNMPIALLARKDTFDSYFPAKAPKPDLTLEREEAIIQAATATEEEAVIVCTTGMISRELFEYRAREGGKHQTDFLTVGGMGHANQIAMGIALKKPNRSIYCFDGDGASLMHMGSMAIVGNSGLSNFVHIVFNNGAHESVGGQPTVGFNINLPQIAAACGYVSAVSVDAAEAIGPAMDAAQAAAGPAFIEIRVLAGHRVDIGRPTTTPLQNKMALMKFLKD